MKSPFTHTHTKRIWLRRTTHTFCFQTLLCMLSKTNLVFNFTEVHNLKYGIGMHRISKVAGTATTRRGMTRIEWRGAQCTNPCQSPWWTSHKQCIDPLIFRNARVWRSNLLERSKQANVKAKNPHATCMKWLKNIEDITVWGTSLLHETSTGASIVGVRKR